MQTLKEETVWNIGKYIRYVNRNRELYNEIMKEEI